MQKVWINGIDYPYNTKAELLSILLQVIDYQSPASVLRQNIKTAFELADKPQGLIDFLDKLKTEEELASFCYNTILNADGHPLLWGFSVQASLNKGRTHYNPERIRISTKHETS